MFEIFVPLFAKLLYCFSNSGVSNINILPWFICPWIQLIWKLHTYVLIMWFVLLHQGQSHGLWLRRSSERMGEMLCDSYSFICLSLFSCALLCFSILRPSRFILTFVKNKYCQTNSKDTGKLFHVFCVTQWRKVISGKSDNWMFRTHYRWE